MLSSNEMLQEKLTAFESACREAGLRLTHQRLEIYRELAMADDHPSAEVLHQRLRRKIPTISLDTVYRTLATFESHGLISKVNTVESQARFEATGMRHHHLICRKCKEIMDFQWQLIDDATLPEEISRWGRIDNKNVVVYGVCSKCLK
ncbi:MAG: transcriptional repressor [Geobacteraceae bacterium]|jgi:Fur family peroxide stress response transcriptional regulator